MDSPSPVLVSAFISQGLRLCFPFAKRLQGAFAGRRLDGLAGCIFPVVCFPFRRTLEGYHYTIVQCAFSQVSWSEKNLDLPACLQMQLRLCFVTNYRSSRLSLTQVLPLCGLLLSSLVLSQFCCPGSHCARRCLCLLRKPGTATPKPGLSGLPFKA